MEEKILRTIIVTSENTQGVLYRIAGIFLRRKINVEYLEVHVLANQQAHFTIKVLTTLNLDEKIRNQISKIIGVNDAKIV